jgi:hypothetical protein
VKTHFETQNQQNWSDPLPSPILPYLGSGGWRRAVTRRNAVRKVWSGDMLALESKTNIPNVT